MNKFRDYGFTLIELLIVIGLIGIVGSILVNTIFSILRGSNKGAVVSAIRSEGNYAMQNMVRALQEADTFDGASSNYGSTYVKPCPVVPAAYTTIKINGTALVSCPNPNTGAKGSFSAIDTNAVSIYSCSISCAQASSIDNPSFVINFTMRQSTTGRLSAGLFENTASVDFSTSVRMRNPVQ
jgi:prepilin-type N-terminal cleavage/methylation domain-containing protein